MKHQVRDRGSKKKRQGEGGRRHVKKPAPQLPEAPNEAPHRAPRPPTPEDDRGDSRG
jgi:hypothetical protein